MSAPENGLGESAEDAVSETVASYLPSLLLNALLDKSFTTRGHARQGRRHHGVLLVIQLWGLHTLPDTMRTEPDALFEVLVQAYAAMVDSVHAYGGDIVRTAQKLRLHAFRCLRDTLSLHHEAVKAPPGTVRRDFACSEVRQPHPPAGPLLPNNFASK